MDWLDRLNSWIPAYFYAPTVVGVWMLALWLAKRLLIRKLKRWAQTTTHRWDDIIIESLSFPFNFLILASGLTILINLLPLPSKADRVMTIVLQGSVIFAVVFFLDSLLKGVIEEFSQKSIFSKVSQGLTKAIVRGFVIGIGVLIFLDLIGISITPILASLGIGSIAVALALQETLSNLFAGLYVALDKPVQVGEYVRLDTGVEGYVADVGWRSTRIRALPNNIVVIPNAKLMSSIITNYHLPDKEIALLVELGVHYQSDLKAVERVTVEVARYVMKNIPGGVPSFEPMVRFHTFGESSVNFTVVMRAKEYTDQYHLKHEFIKALHDRYRRENIVIPYPIRTLEISKEFGQKLSMPDPR